jgi:hypothetical protein
MNWLVYGLAIAMAALEGLLFYVMVRQQRYDDE